MTEQQRKDILVETVKQFGRQEWFRDAVVHDSYPTTREATLEFKVNYVPVLDRKTVMSFAATVGLRELFTQVDRDGNPAV